MISGGFCRIACGCVSTARIVRVELGRAAGGPGAVGGAARSPQGRGRGSGMPPPIPPRTAYPRGELLEVWEAVGKEERNFSLQHLLQSRSDGARSPLRCTSGVSWSRAEAAKFSKRNSLLPGSFSGKTGPFRLPFAAPPGKEGWGSSPLALRRQMPGVKHAEGLQGRTKTRSQPPQNLLPGVLKRRKLARPSPEKSAGIFLIIISFFARSSGSVSHERGWAKLNYWGRGHAGVLPPPLPKRVGSIHAQQVLGFFGGFWCCFFSKPTARAAAGEGRGPDPRPGVNSLGHVEGSGLVPRAARRLLFLFTYLLPWGVREGEYIALFNWNLIRKIVMDTRLRWRIRVRGCMMSVSSADFKKPILLLCHFAIDSSPY